MRLKVVIESQFLKSPASLSAALQALFPPGVIAAEMRVPGDPLLLYPKERESVKRAVAKRVHEFAAGRICARRALDEFGIFNFQLLPASDRQPIWPISMVGSITHTSGYCAAAAASSSQVRALGLDAERVEAVKEELWPTICGPDEAAWVSSLPAGEQPVAVALLFSAKEAFYKCQFALTGEWLDFHDLRIELYDWGSDAAEFKVHPTRKLQVDRFAPHRFQGRYRFSRELVTVGVALLT